MVRNDDAIEIDLGKGFHDIVHVHVTVVGHGFIEVGHGTANVPEMNLEDVALGAEIMYARNDVITLPIRSCHFAAGAGTEKYT